MYSAFVKFSWEFGRSWINKELSLAPEVVDNELDQEDKKGSQHNSQCDFKYHADLARTGDALFGASLWGRFYFTQKSEELGFCGENQRILLG